MTDYQVIVLVCALGVVGEATRLQRRGQVMLGPDWLGRYRHRELTGGAVVRLLPLFPQAPAFRLAGKVPLAGLSAAEHLNLERAAEKIAAVQAATGEVLPFSRLLFVFLLGLVPLALLTGLVSYPWYVIGLGLLAIQVPLLTQFGLNHRKVHPAERGQRLQDLLMMLMFPPAGVSACEAFASGTLSGVHPLAATLILCPEDEVRRVAARYLRRWSHPLASDDAESCQEYLQVARGLVAARGLPVAELLQPPVRHDPASLSYCPRCEAQFRIAEGTCPDCPGVARELFEA